MKAFKCEICESSDIIKQDGMFCCQNCGMKYSLDEIKSLISSENTEKDPKESDFKFNVKTGTILKYIGSDKNIEIPSTIDNVYVNSIGNYAFYSSNISSIKIPESVTTIGKYSFSYCTNLTGIELPDSVKNIGYCAFGYCSNLNYLVIGNHVENIGDYAFSNCIRLSELTLPDSVINIGDWAFGYCRGLKRITVGYGLTGIGNNAFFNCKGRFYIYKDSVVYNYLTGNKIIPEQETKNE